jgi:hypothetical protein
MIVGNAERFAIEACIEGVEDGWTLGRLRFWLGNMPVGNWKDVVDLKGCVGWLRDFYQNPRNRFEPALEDLSPEDVFARCYDPVMAGATPNAGRIPNAYARFHISHLGMSSFERFDLLLLKSEQGDERCLWR